MKKIMKSKTAGAIIVTVFCLWLALIGVAVAGRFYSSVTFMRDVQVGSWLSITNVSAQNFTTGGTYTNGIYTNWYRINGTNRDGRLPVSLSTNVIWTGTTNQSNAVIVTWLQNGGINNYIIERSTNGTLWDSWLVVPGVASTSWTDYGTNTWTNSIFTNVFATEVPAPDVPWTNAVFEWNYNLTNNLNARGKDITKANIISASNFVMLGAAAGGGFDFANLGQVSVTGLTIGGIRAVTLEGDPQWKTNAVYITDKWGVFKAGYGTNLNAALAAQVADDTIRIRSGVYYGNAYQVLNQGVRIVGDGAESTILCSSNGLIGIMGVTGTTNYFTGVTFKGDTNNPVVLYMLGQSHVYLHQCSTISPSKEVIAAKHTFSYTPVHQITAGAGAANASHLYAYQCNMATNIGTGLSGGAGYFDYFYPCMTVYNPNYFTPVTNDVYTSTLVAGRDAAAIEYALTTKTIALTHVTATSVTAIAFTQGTYKVVDESYSITAGDYLTGGGYMTNPVIDLNIDSLDSRYLQGGSTWQSKLTIGDITGVQTDLLTGFGLFSNANGWAYDNCSYVAGQSNVMVSYSITNAVLTYTNAGSPFTVVPGSAYYVTYYKTTDDSGETIVTHLGGMESTETSSDSRLVQQVIHAVSTNGLRFNIAAPYDSVFLSSIQVYPITNGYFGAQDGWLVAGHIRNDPTNEYDMIGYRWMTNYVASVGMTNILPLSNIWTGPSNTFQNPVYFEDTHHNQCQISLTESATQDFTAAGGDEIVTNWSSCFVIPSSQFTVTHSGIVVNVTGRYAVKNFLSLSTGTAADVHGVFQTNWVQALDEAGNHIGWHENIANASDDIAPGVVATLPIAAGTFCSWALDFDGNETVTWRHGLLGLEQK
jgi:hypothetical protein